MYILNSYDEVLQKILTDGSEEVNRTGVNTLALYGTQCHYDISESFPLPTRRKYAYKSIFAELLWMLSGSTNVNDLEAMGSKIWSAWRDQEFEKKNGYVDGQLGPIYGWQFRNFGGKYPEAGSGFDQVQFCMEELLNNKKSRRIMINLWNPADMASKAVRLPCCHFSFQLMVDSLDRVTGVLTQRSGDWLPGVSANVFFYSALIYMFAQQAGLKPYKLVHNVNNAHIYVNQIEQAKEYLNRPLVDSPKLKLKKAEDIFSYELDDFQVEGYNPLPAIKIPVAV
jgi:thymidylate synthase